ncbi:MAG: 50S ribosomal protein L29 [Anaeroplasmataceae bacterium]|nr:50S ribosomal protein L29 [Anaeroplasmataceae bacterium]
MKVNDIRNLTTDEIVKKIEETKEELFNLRFQQATGNLEKPSRIKELRKLIARLKTVLHERELKEM